MFRSKLPGLTRSTGLITHPFDLANGVRTSGLVAGRNLKSGHAHDRHATAYFGVAPSVFDRLIRHWQRTRPFAPIAETTFFDVGAGMGRAVLLAAQMPFRRIVGVELNPALARIARRNLAIWRKTGRACCPAAIAEGDAAGLAFPVAPSVLFLFNPFGAVVMRRLLQALARRFAANPGQLDILYVNHEQESVLEQHRGFVRIFAGKVRRSRADAIADRRILTSQPGQEYAYASCEECSIWRWTGRS
jgi:SAM-dependent methyltransferase